VAKPGPPPTPLESDHQVAEDAARTGAALREQMRETERCMALVRQQVEAAQAEIRSLGKERERLSQELATAAHTSAGLRKKGQEAEAQIALVRQQAEVSEVEIRSLRQERDQLAQELAALRQDARTGQEQHLRASQEDREKARREMRHVEELLGEVREFFRQAGQRFLTGLDEQLTDIRQGVAVARQMIDQLPRQAGEIQDRLADLRRRLPAAESQLLEVEKAAAGTQLSLESVDADNRQARERLTGVLRDTAAAEKLLASIRVETAEAERRLVEARLQVEQVKVRAEETALRLEEKPQEQATEEKRNHLGLTVAPGVVVAEVQPSSPAAHAGLMKGDVILAFNGQEIHSGADLRDLIQGMVGSDAVTIRVTRGGTPLEVPATLETPGGADLPEGRNRLGVTVAPGAVVAEIQPDSPAAEADLLRGDVILTFNGQAVVTGDQLRQFMQSLAEDAEITLGVRRADEEREVHVRLDGQARSVALA